MNFDPQKFFIGLMDFFSILLPGALLTWLLVGEVGPAVLGDRYHALAGAEAWAAFLFASYLFGHLVFLLGSWLDKFYDWARRYTLNAQGRRAVGWGDEGTPTHCGTERATHVGVRTSPQPTTRGWYGDLVDGRWE